MDGEIVKTLSFLETQSHILWCNIATPLEWQATHMITQLGDSSIGSSAPAKNTDDKDAS